MSKLFARQLAKAAKADGTVDVDILRELVEETYLRSDRDRVRTDRSISLMVQELDALNANLSQLVEDRTADLRSREQELKAQNSRFDAALNNMSQGLCMFDSDKRLIVCNKNYADLYRLTEDQVTPGTTLHTIIGYRIAKGSAPPNAERYMAARLSEVSINEPYQTLDCLQDGRYIFVKHRPMSDGGWVATHEDVTEKIDQENLIHSLAHNDLLTGLPNRVSFNKFFEETLRAASERGTSFAVLAIDLDHFKEINDEHGHIVGDALLAEVGRRLRAAADTIFVARVGGDEFMAVMTEGEQPAAAEAFTERLIAVITREFEVEGRRLSVGLSVGSALYPSDGTDAKTLLGNADAALYRAKAEFRGSAVFYSEEMGQRLRERRELQNDLRLAITRNEFLLHYQPQLTMAGEVTGFEALVRWQCAKRGFVPPGDFIPMAEETGLIIPLGEWILREACREAASWARPLSIAVNISPVQFRRSDLPRLVHTILLETGLSPNRLELEITEGVLINDFSHAVSVLRKLKALGVQIAMDDFGAGYSSLSYLHSFSFDKIKIDRTFVGDLEKNRNSLAIVRTIISLGRNLGVPLLAEGVETAEQHTALAQEGCDVVQGYLTGRPLPIGNYAEVVGRGSQPDKKRIAG